MNLVDPFYTKTQPIKITEARKLPMKSTSWSMISHYYLEYVKINKYYGKPKSSAIIKIGDRSGGVSCLIEGSNIRYLFGLEIEKWQEIEQLCEKELFYRYFKDGLSKDLNLTQRIFYYFCQTNQASELLVAKFRREVNMRKNEKGRPFVQIIELRKSSNHLLDLYLSGIRIENEDDGDLADIGDSLKKQKISVD